MRGTKLAREGRTAAHRDLDAMREGERERDRETPPYRPCLNLIAGQPSEAMGAGPARVRVAALEPSTSDAKQPTQEGAVSVEIQKWRIKRGNPFRVESNRSSRRKVEIEDFQTVETQFNEIGSLQ